MPDVNRIVLQIKIDHLDESDRLEGHGRDSFWEPLIRERLEQINRTVPRPKPPTIAKIEAQLHQVFGNILKRELTNYFSVVAYGENRFGPDLAQASVAIPDEYALLLPKVGFQLTQISYSSLDLSIEIAGAKSLAKLFDSNFELFWIFLQGHLPIVFQRSLYEIGLPGQPMQITIINSPALAQVFASESIAQRAMNPAGLEPVAPPAAKSPDRLQSIWLISNLSLVVPVLLAIAVAYVALRSMQDERTEWQARMKVLDAREQAALKESRERITKLEEAQVQLITVLRMSRVAPDKSP
jgi:hypothetical protein